MQFTQLIERATQIRHKYAQLEERSYGRSWTREEIALGFVGDVGDLAKLVVASEGVRNIPNVKEKLAHELADCLWSIIILAQLHDVDLEAAFGQTMDQLEEHIDEKLRDE